MLWGEGVQRAYAAASRHKPCGSRWSMPAGFALSEPADLSDDLREDYVT